MASTQGITSHGITRLPPDSSFPTDLPPQGAQGLWPGQGAGVRLLDCPGFFRAQWSTGGHGPFTSLCLGLRARSLWLGGGGPAVWLQWASEGARFLSIGTMSRSASVSGFRRGPSAGVSCPQSPCPLLAPAGLQDFGYGNCWEKGVGGLRVAWGLVCEPQGRGAVPWPL